jgi:hypothetical protein
MNTQSKHKIRYTCPDCGSTVKRELVEGIVQEYCTNDLLHEYSKYFEWFTRQPQELQTELMLTWDDHKSGLYAQWYISTQDITQPFECTFKVDPRAKLFSPSKCTITFPDTAQVMISEWILKRQLTEIEKIGEERVPLVDEEGNLTEGNVTLLRYPDDVTLKYKDMYDKTTYEDMPVLFDKERL